MRKTFFAFLAGILLAGSAHAQVYVMDYDMFRNRNVKVKLQVQDARSEEALPFATVYLNRQGDTTITHFALSDQKGAVEIADVPAGRYRLNVELIGYTPFSKDYNFRDYEEDLGVVKLEENPEIIDAASITAVGNAVEVRQDTLIYNAAAFHVGDNAMLEDLIKKMPGMEVGEDGTVKVNGEPVDKITVGGRTFFFNDPSAALKNLPAKIVDKIKVVDRENEEAAFSGIASQDSREKVMDLELKEEYKEGWFGNAKLGGGYRQGRDDAGLRDDRHGLFVGNFLLSGYNEKDQLTLIANGQNASEPGSPVAIFINAEEDMEDMDIAGLFGGLKTSAMAGANLNSDRIKGMESTATVSYNFSDQVSGQRSSRLSAVVGEDPLSSESLSNDRGTQNRVNVNFELKKKDTKKFNFVFRPRFRFSDASSFSHDESATRDALGAEINRADATQSSRNRAFQAGGNLTTGIKDLGKPRRSLSLRADYNFKNNRSRSEEDSRTWYGTEMTPRQLHYDGAGNGQSVGGTLSYLEPFGESWGLAAIATTRWQRQASDKDAFNPDGSANAYYSSGSRSDYLLLDQSLQMQYKKENKQFFFGVQHAQTRNEIRSRSLGQETSTGIGEWLHDWAPYLSVRTGGNGHSLYFNYEGRSNQVSGTRIAPVLDISNPLQISTGNVYLRPSFRHNVSMSWNYNDKKTFSYVSLYLSGSMTRRGTVSATWFDPDGVRYSVPVNTHRPSYSIYSTLSWRQPLGAEKNWTLDLSLSCNLAASTGYQARGRKAGMNLATFDYNAFMADFWGDESGSRFYGGQSGFAESRTKQAYCSGYLSVEYSLDRFTSSFYAEVENNRSRYSLDPSANTTFWDFNYSLDLLYETRNGWEFKSTATYRHFLGYSAGYDKPYCTWNLGVSKTVKAFTLSLGVSDLLNQARSLQRIADAEYIEDSYRLVMGRYALFSVKWNFGKMNPAKNGRVQDAMYNML